MPSAVMKFAAITAAGVLLTYTFYQMMLPPAHSEQMSATATAHAAHASQVTLPARQDVQVKQDNDSLISALSSWGASPRPIDWRTSLPQELEIRHPTRPAERLQQDFNLGLQSDIALSAVVPECFASKERYPGLYFPELSPDLPGCGYDALVRIIEQMPTSISQASSRSALNTYSQALAQISLKYQLSEIEQASVQAKWKQLYQLRTHLEHDLLRDMAHVSNYCQTSGQADPVECMVFDPEDPTNLY